MADATEAVTAITRYADAFRAARTQGGGELSADGARR
jgi:hypothetical protein